MAKISLRPVAEADLPILFQQQLEPEAVAMSAYPSKDRGEFMRHWEGILKNKNVTARAIIYKEKVAGHIICWFWPKFPFSVSCPLSIKMKKLERRPCE